MLSPTLNHNSHGCALPRHALDFLPQTLKTAYTCIAYKAFKEDMEITVSALLPLQLYFEEFPQFFATVQLLNQLYALRTDMLTMLKIGAVQ